MTSNVDEAIGALFDGQRVAAQSHAAYVRDIQERVASMSQFSTDITDKVSIISESGLIHIDGVGSMLLFDELVKYNQQEAISNFGIKLPESDILIKLNSAVQSNVDFYRQILRMDGTTYYSRSNNAGGSALGLDIDNGEYTGICQQNGAIEQHVRLFDELTS